MFSLNTSSDKALLTTIEDTTKMFLRVWKKQRDVTFIDGYACYLNFTDNGLHFTAGTSRIEIERNLDFDRTHSIVKDNSERYYKISISFSTADYRDRFPYEPLTLCNDFVSMKCTTVGKEMENIDIPYEGINEVDFFQFETLGVICPLTAKTLSELVHTMREIL